MPDLAADATAAPGFPLLDTRAARTAQAVVAVLVAAAAALGDWRLLALPALHLALAAALGRRGNLPVRAFDAYVRPRLSSASFEDARPPRFASTVGAVFLGASLLAHAAGAHALGWVLALAVGALAGLAAATGLCIGCRLYWVVVLVRRFRIRSAP
ncbi:MAG TPA: DUF4395 family protein [Anaeromyxobacter sp.]